MQSCVLFPHIIVLIFILTSIPSVCCDGGREMNNTSLAVPDMCYFCFDVLNGHLRSLEPATPNFTNDAFPLFVTWKIGQEQRLRGCKGTFDAIPLHSGLRDYTLISALNDARFSPITIEELPLLTVTVSILQHFVEAENYLDWVIGRHGIRIAFVSNGENRTATFLPGVATEQGWNQIQTIDRLLRKGGHRGAITEDVRRGIKLTRYQTDKISASYDEYISQRV